MFFTTTLNVQGKALVEFLGGKCNSNDGKQLCDAVMPIQHNAVAWRKSFPSSSRHGRYARLPCQLRRLR
jgi:hypothetical protein